jgi:hypothetical protein
MTTFHLMKNKKMSMDIALFLPYTKVTTIVVHFIYAIIKLLYGFITPADLLPKKNKGTSGDPF